MTQVLSKSVSVDPDSVLRDKHTMRSQPLFIFGCPRSGTTYLGELLSHHSKVLVTNELRMMSFYAEMLAAAEKARHQIHNRDLRSGFIAHMKSQVRSTVETYYKSLAESLGRKIEVWGDKTPGYADPSLSPGCLEFILEVFPDARFIHIRRDPLEVIRSIVGKRWMGLDAAIDIWVRITKRGREFGALLPPSQYLEITHEELSGNGEKVTSEILRFLGIQDETHLREFVTRESEERTPFSDPIALPGKKSAFDLTPEQVARVHELLGDDWSDVDAVFRKYGDRKTSSPGTAQHVAVVAAGTLIPVAPDTLLGDLEARINALGLAVNDEPVASGAAVRTGDKVVVTARVAALRPFEAIVFGVTAFDDADTPVMGGNNAKSGLQVFSLPPGMSTLVLVFNWPDVGNGTYRLTVGIGEGSDSDNNLVQCWADKAITLVQQSPQRNGNELVRCTILDARRET